MPTPEATNTAAFRRLHDAFNARDPELISKAIDEVAEPDMLLRTPLPIDVTGAQALREVTTSLVRAFPDLQITAEDVIAHGDKVVSRNTVTGTHQGDYMGLPATGRTVTYNEIFIFRFVDGRIAETWGVVDVLTLLRQLSVAPLVYSA